MPRVINRLSDRLVRNAAARKSTQKLSDGAGLYAISLGLSATIPNDHEMLRHGLTLYDALYAWCTHFQSETHNWPPAGYRLAS
jgi:hypothetical protein